jgi:autotransporter-associated beta strand protein
MVRHDHGGIRLADQDWATQTASLVAAGLNAPGGAGSDNWVGGTDGNGDWNTAADWSGGVPATTDTATFATGLAGYLVTGDATIAGIVVDGDQVTFDGAITQDPSGGATFLTGTNDAQVTLDANSFFTGSGLDFADGTLLEVQGILITTGGTADVVLDDGLDGQIISSGQLQVNQLYVQSGGSFTGDVALNAGGNITLDTSSSFGGGTVSLLGAGLIYDAAAPGQTSGTTGIGDAIVFEQAGAVLSLGADPGVTLAIGGPISGAGLVLVTGGTVELMGTNTYTGGTVVQGGTLQVDGAGAVPGGIIFVSDGTVITQNANAGSSTGSTINLTYTDTIVASGGIDAVNAAAGNQLVFAGPAGALYYTGGTGNSTVIGGSGYLVAAGGTGNDLIFGGSSGADQLYTGAGNTTLVGGSGATLYANGGGNVALAATGTGETLNALAATGNTTLFGGSGSNTIIGGYGTDYAVLADGNSAVYAGHGTMDVFAGSGVLSLDFVVGFADDGTTNVIGFNTATDSIDLVGYANGAAEQALASATITGGNTILALPDHATAVFFGVTDLTLNNFT